MRAVKWVVVVLVASLTTLMGPAYADEGLSVTWSSTTRLNPDLVDYTFAVDDTGAGDLVASWGSSDQGVGIPHTGEVAFSYPADYGDCVCSVYLYRCNPSCVYVAKSPLVELRRRITIEGQFSEDRYGPDGPSGSFGLYPGDAPLEVSWSVNNTDDPSVVLLDGAQLVDDGHFKVMDRSIAGLSTGEYELRIHASGEHPVFGPIEGDRVEAFQIDATAPVSVLKVLDHEVFPERDEYRDYARVMLEVDDDEGIFDAVLETFDAQGARVDSTSLDRQSSGVVVFRGRAHGASLPEGNYTLRVSGEDFFGNRSVSAPSSPIRVDHRGIVTKTYRQTFKPAAVVLDQYVGACSRLAKPSGRGGQGSLGYYSQTRCTRPGTDSIVGTVSGVYLPKLTIRSRLAYYDDVRLTMIGGRVAGAKRAYINSGFYASKQDEVDRVTSFPGEFGKHVIRERIARDVIRDRRKRPYVAWFTGLTDGSRYDVVKYVLEVTYVDLEDPTRGRVESSDPERHPMRYESRLASPAMVHAAQTR